MHNTTVKRIKGPKPNKSSEDASYDAQALMESYTEKLLKRNTESFGEASTLDL